MTDNQSESIELNTPKSWEISRAYAHKIGEMPQSFTSSIRMLLIDHEKNNAQISNPNVTQAALLLNSDSLKAMFYYAIKTFRGEQLESESYLTKRKLATFFNPQELSCIMAISLLYRRCKKLAPSDLFSPLAEKVKLRVNVGGFVGQTIPHIGLGWGILAGGARLLGEVAFILHDKDGYQKYLNRKSTSGLPFDVEFETSRWGCTSIQIASNLLQNMGLGLNFGECLTAGLDPRTPEELIQEDRFYRIKVAQLWIDALIETGEIPQITHRGNYYPMEAALKKLKADVQSSPAVDSDYNWLDKNKSDVSESNTPQLFRGAGSGSSSAQTSSEAVSDEDMEAAIEELQDDLLGG